MSDEVFKALMGLVMASDPSPITDNEDKIIRDWLDKESVARGFSDWIDAYHRIK